MAVCYWCFWGWPKPIADVYNDALKKLQAISDQHGEQDLEYGPAHIVWNEENWDDDSVQFCIDACDNVAYADIEPAVLAIVRASLVDLKSVPVVFRVEPDGYENDDDHPERYPPPANWHMMQRR